MASDYVRCKFDVRCKAVNMHDIKVKEANITVTSHVGSNSQVFILKL